MYGQPVDLDPLAALCRARGLLLLEDAAQAHGARYRGRAVGGAGEAAALSFHPSKNLGAFGDGGAVLTSSDALASRLRIDRNLGKDGKYRFASIGPEQQARHAAGRHPRGQAAPPRRLGGATASAGGALSDRAGRRGRPGPAGRAAAHRARLSSLRGADRAARRPARAPGVAPESRPACTIRSPPRGSRRWPPAFAASSFPSPMSWPARCCRCRCRTSTTIGTSTPSSTVCATSSPPPVGEARRERPGHPGRRARRRRVRGPADRGHRVVFRHAGAAAAAARPRPGAARRDRVARGGPGRRAGLAAPGRRLPRARRRPRRRRGGGAAGAGGRAGRARPRRGVSDPLRTGRRRGGRPGRHGQRVADRAGAGRDRAPHRRARSGRPCAQPDRAAGRDDAPAPGARPLRRRSVRAAGADPRALARRGPGRADRADRSGTDGSGAGVRRSQSPRLLLVSDEPGARPSDAARRGGARRGAGRARAPPRRGAAALLRRRVRAGGGARPRTPQGAAGARSSCPVYKTLCCAGSATSPARRSPSCSAGPRRGSSRRWCPRSAPSSAGRATAAR